MPKYSPKRFYYEETRSGQTYSRTPTDNLDVGKMVEGKPYWIHSTSPTEKKQKNLILADWRASNWSADEVLKIKTTLASLIDDGFLVFVWLNDTLRPIQKSDLFQLDDADYCKQINPAHTDVIMEAGVHQLQSTRDKLHVLDEHGIRKLLNEEQDEIPRALYVSDLLSMDEEKKRAVLAMLQHATPPVTEIIQNHCWKHSNQAHALCQAFFPGIAVKVEYTSAIFNNLEDFLAMDAKSLASLKSIDLRFDLTVEAMEHLLKVAPNVEKISFSSIRSDFSYVLETDSFKSLKKVDCAFFASSIFLKQISVAAPNLRTLEISSEVLVSDQRQDYDYLSGIENLTISEGDEGPDLASLNCMLNAAQHLKQVRLHLKAENTSDQSIRIEPSSLSSLTVCDLRQNTLSINMGGGSPSVPGSYACHILQTAKQLKKVFLALGEEDNAFEALTENSLESLEELNFMAENDPNVTIALERLLKASPNLKRLTCEAEINLVAPVFSLNENSFLSLEVVDLACSPGITADILSNLLKAAPNLRELRCEGSLREFELMNVLMTTPNQLEAISFKSARYSSSSAERSPFSYYSLLQLKEKLPSLKFINDISIDQLLELKRQSRVSQSASSSEPTHMPAAEPEQSSSASSVSSFQPHNSQSKRAFSPTPLTQPVVFRGDSKTHDQGMIIDKLSRYLMLTQQHEALVPRIQNGICHALSQYFLTQSLESLQNFFESMVTWDGQLDTLDTGLITQMDALTSHVSSIYAASKQIQENSWYIGEQLDLFLSNLKTGCLLGNPWHTIAIRPRADGQWDVYDPNFLDGPKTLSQDALLSQLHQSLGHLISVQLPKTEPQPNLELEIGEPQVFIERGGVLALCTNDNADAMLEKIPPNVDYSKQSLDGLLLRNLKGIPAWVRGLQSPNVGIATLTQSLLQQFMAKNSDHIQQLVHSMACMTPQQQHFCIASLAKKGAPVSQQALIAAIRSSSNEAQYDKQLKTWDKSNVLVDSVPEYTKTCLQVTEQNSTRLIELTSTEQVDTMRLQLERAARSTHRPVFLIDDPDDLICSAPYMKRDANNRGTIQKGPGGALYDFLMTHQTAIPPPLLVVNYDRFNADDLVRFNALLDKVPKADGTPLPTGTQVIGLINTNKPDCYQGSDFYSRFKQVERCPLTTKQLKQASPKNLVSLSSEAPAIGINLYHAANWRDRLLGHWVMKGDSLTFEEGELYHAMRQAVQQNKPIEIQQGLWDEPEFQRFWDQIRSTGIRHAGRTICLPPSVVRITHPAVEQYDWDVLRQAIVSVDHTLSQDAEAMALNPTQLGSFFGQYQYDAVLKGLIKTDGIVKAGVLSVNVTRQLNLDEWAMLLARCNQYNIRLAIHASSGLDLPSVLQVTPSEPSVLDATANYTRGMALACDAVITSSDPDTTTSQLTRAGEYEVIDISECGPADLLQRLDGSFDSETLRFKFNEIKGAVLHALEQNKKLILKGHFSDELKDALAVLLLERQREVRASTGQLILVTDTKETTSFAANAWMHTVEVDEKYHALGFLDDTLKEKIAPFMEHESLGKLKARVDYLKLNPSALSSDDAWIGMRHSVSMPMSTKPLNTSTSAAETRAWIDARKQALNEVLENAPYVFITGMSGVGKSTFVQKEWCESGDVLYSSEAAMQDWINDKTPNQRKLLFLDEANLSTRQWSEFEGLFETPPSILFKGVLYPLTAEHKVVFAGNPVSYGDERTLAPFFERHGHAVLFNPIPPAVLYEQILKPVFSVSDEVEKSVEISRRILDIYAFFCKISKTDVLITPRELQMMALLTLSRSRQYPEQDIGVIAEHVTYQLSSHLVPQALKNNFDAQFKPKTSLVMPKTQDSNAFLVTESREATLHQLNDVLSLREWRRGAASTDMTDEQKYGGLGGILIEGAPGIGKSELVIETLLSKGYQEEHDFEHKSTRENPFYRMPVSLSYPEKEALLLKAFHEGAVVCIDEMNSSPMMERLLNDLFMGKTPDNKRPEKAGFMVIGTQNPVTMAGRRSASTALQRRLITIELPEYNTRELQAILTQKGVVADEVTSMVRIYEKHRAYAIKQHLQPVPNFRDLCNVADAYIKSNVPMSQALDSNLSAIAASKNQNITKQYRAALANMVGDDGLGEEASPVVPSHHSKPN
jgi:hypothetical protein